MPLCKSGAISQNGPSEVPFCFLFFCDVPFGSWLNATRLKTENGNMIHLGIFLSVDVLSIILWKRWLNVISKYIFLASFYKFQKQRNALIYLLTVKLISLMTQFFVHF